MNLFGQLPVACEKSLGLRLATADLQTLRHERAGRTEKPSDWEIRRHTSAARALFRPIFLSNRGSVRFPERMEPRRRTRKRPEPIRVRYLQSRQSRVVLDFGRRVRHKFRKARILDVAYGMTDLRLGEGQRFYLRGNRQPGSEPVEKLESHGLRNRNEHVLPPV